MDGQRQPPVSVQHAWIASLEPSIRTYHSWIARLKSKTHAHALPLENTRQNNRRRKLYFFLFILSRVSRLPSYCSGTNKKISIAHFRRFVRTQEGQ